MPGILSPPKIGFESDLKRVEILLELMKSLRAFGSVSVDGVVAGETFTDAALAIREDLRKASSDLPVSAGTLLLYLAGRFEYFVRELFEALCDEIAGRCRCLGDLPEKMRQSLIRQTAEVVASPGRYGFDEPAVQAFVIRLAENMTANQSLGQINSACLSITDRNMNGTMLAELFKRAGIENLWADIGKQSAMKMFFATSRDNEATRQAHSALDGVMTLRNNIAHPSSSTTFPDFDKVLEHLRFLLTLGSVLQEILEVHLTAAESATI